MWTVPVDVTLLDAFYDMVFFPIGPPVSFMNTEYTSESWKDTCRKLSNLIFYKVCVYVLNGKFIYWVWDV